jgi:hypothetical protein
MARDRKTNPLSPDKATVTVYAHRGKAEAAKRQQHSARWQATAKIRAEYRQGVQDGINKSASAGLRDKRSKSARMTKEEKESVYRPKSKTRDVLNQNNRLIYDPNDVDRMRKRKILEEVRRENELRRANGQNAKLQQRMRDNEAAKAEQNANLAKVAERNALEGITAGFGMPMPKVLGTVEAENAKRERGETVVNISGKRRLSVILMQESSKSHVLNWVCACFLLVAIAVVVAFAAKSRDGEPGDD